MKNKTRKLKNINKPVSEENEVKTFIIIVIIILLLIAIVYGGTELLNKKTVKEEEKTVEINYNVLSVGTIFNAPYDDYYALIFNSEDIYSSKYSVLLSLNNKKKVYFIDLKNKFNNDYYNVNKDGKSNPKAQNISELNLGDLTLLEIKDKKIVNYIEDYEEIKNLLSK